jgi:hypothetical protein
VTAPAEDHPVAGGRQTLQLLIQVNSVGGGRAWHGSRSTARLDLKLEVGAHGAGTTRHVRLAMKSLGSRECRTLAWDPTCLAWRTTSSWTHCGGTHARREPTIIGLVGAFILQKSVSPQDCIVASWYFLRSEEKIFCAQPMCVAWGANKPALL